MPQHNLRGMGVALTTPFRTDETVDFDALKRHVEFLVERGADYIVTLGTTAETPTLSASEKREIRHTVLDVVAGRIPVMLGAGGNNTASLISELKSLERADEYAAILSVVPYYNKPVQEGMYRHFARVAEASPVPVMLYNIPGRTGVNMDVDTISRLAYDFRGQIIGIKEASGNMEQIHNVIARRPEGFLVVSGDDSLAHAVIGIGGDGVISVLGNAYPKEFASMISVSLDPERHNEAAAIHQQFTALYSMLFKQGNPAGIKALLSHLLPYYPNVLRLPLVEVTEDLSKALYDEMLNMQRM